VIVVDTGVLFGAIDADDPHHADCAGVLDSHAAAPLGVVVPVIVETAWLIESRLGPAAEATFLGSLGTGELERIEMTDADWARVAELVGSYADLGLGVVDASVVAVAERLGITTVASLDRRHFSVVRPRHVDAFELIP
jgi:predicted nucleic acid-binding protein